MAHRDRSLLKTQGLRRLGALGSLALVVGCAPVASLEPDAGPAPVTCDAEDEPEELWRVEESLVIFSSPRATDLDGDGVKDVVLGRGGDNADTGGAMALSGDDGARVWKRPSPRPLVGSATLMELDGEGGVDVLLGGRDASLYALRGEDGDTLWSWENDAARLDEGWLNFYTGQPLADLDEDGVRDVLISNGGYGAAPAGAPRPPGHLAVLSGKTGAVLAFMETPDQAETYMSPLVYDHPDGRYVLLGTGGETLPGGLWRISLEDVLAERAEAAELLVAQSEKGVIAPPSLTDLTGDGILDIVVATHQGYIAALDGDSGDELWRLDREGRETYVTPGLGYLNDDDVPDVFAQLSVGVWPSYTGAEHIAIDGATGDVLWEDSFGSFVSSGPLLADLDEDGIDEVFFGVNTSGAQGTRYDLYLFRPTAARAELLLGEIGSLSLAAPLIDDLDGDGCYDLVVSAGTGRDGPMESSVTLRYRLHGVASRPPSWGAYLGTSYDGKLER